MAKAPRAQQHDHADPMQCSHCGLVLKQLEDIARLLKLQLRHEVPTDAFHAAECASATCWCKV